MAGVELAEKLRRLTAFPEAYWPVNDQISRELECLHSLANGCRSQGMDPSSYVDSSVTLDLADRVERLMRLKVSERLRSLLGQYRTEHAALVLAEEVALGKFGLLNTEEALDLGVRTGLAVVTDGVTVAPLQGISSIKIKQNDDSSSYASIYFAGPIRSAGGTEAAFTIAIADRIRMALGLDRYHANGWGEDEVGRFEEELRVYERDIGNFQYKISDEDLRYTLEHLPVEVAGVETDPVEVVIHRGMRRIETDRVRGGALRVLNDGVIGRSRKLLKLTQDLSIEGWEWLADLKGGRQSGVDETAPAGAHFDEVISGRPVLASPKKLGGLRLRYGRSRNTGLSTMGLHPALATLLDHPVVVGTQIKVDLPGKAGTVAFVESIDPPTVRLKDGSVMRIPNLETAKKVTGDVEEILHLGDILVSFGDFLENNAKLPPSGYVEEWWAQDVEDALAQRGWSMNQCAERTKIPEDTLRSYLIHWSDSSPSASEAFLLSETLDVPLHPRYLFYWDLATPSELLLLRQHLSMKVKGLGNWAVTARRESEVKLLLERIGVPHTMEGDQITLEGDIAFAVARTLHLHSEVSIGQKWKDVCEMLSILAGVPIRRKMSAYVGVRVGRPEKAMLRRMKPPVHTLFPVGGKGGPTRDLLRAAEGGTIELEVINLLCESCRAYCLTSRCHRCGNPTIIVKRCPRCERSVDGESCPQCKVGAVPYGKISFPLKEALDSAISKLRVRPKRPLKGVQGLTNATKTPEALEKGVLRNRYDLSIYKDGTIRFDATNAPLTHFRPREVGAPVERLHSLGYLQSSTGEPLTSEDQLLELFAQDIILPVEAGDCLLRMTKFIDELLIRVYGEKPYYNTDSREALIGHLVVGLAPHTSVGILGRIIGFTSSQVCFAHPYWHSAKRRDCDGDEDAILLLLDLFLNFSADFLPAQIGGLMDAPLLLQPFIIPHEVQRQAHNFDVEVRYPRKFYEATQSTPPPSDVVHLINIVRNRLKNEAQFHGFGFSHPTDYISTAPYRSSYSTAKTLREKLEKQIHLAEKVSAVDPDEVVESVLRTHLIPDIIGNMKAYASQSFRCKSCGTQYRRVPVRGTCLRCAGELQSTVPRKAVEKYLQIALSLTDRFHIDPYLRGRLKVILQELNSLFAPQKIKSQTELTQFILEKSEPSSSHLLEAPETAR